MTQAQENSIVRDIRKIAQNTERMESKLADLPDGYWGHIQVIGGGDQG